MWYKRICQVMFAASLLVVVLYAVTYFMWLSALAAALPPVNLIAAILAVATLFTSLAGFIFRHGQPSQLVVALTSYFLYLTMTLYIVAVSGHNNPVFISLWVLAAILAGCFGIWGLAIIAVATNGYLIGMLLVGATLTPNDLILFIAAGELPLILGYIIWHKKLTKGKEEGKAYHELAKELSVASSKSDVIINAITDGVIALDSSGSIEVINPAAQQLLGWSAEDALNLDYRSVLKLADKTGEPIDTVIDPVQSVMTAKKAIVNDDLQLTTKSGKQLIVSLHVSPISGEKTGAIIVFRDITSEKKRELEQAEFISTASHEMRTPVASIEGYIGLALNPQTAQIDDKARGYLGKAHEAAQNLGRLFQDLLDISKAEDGRLSVSAEVIDINALVLSVAADFTPKAQAKGLSLVCPVQGGSDESALSGRTINPILYSYADKGRTREIISNLIENAIKYTKEGTIIVDATGDDSTVIVTITDSGLGIPPEDIPHLFQKFYRVDNSATREIGGTGLGLYLCRRLAEAMNGRIWVTSDFGKGSKFYFQLPRLASEEAAEKAATVTIDPEPQQAG